MSEFLRLSTPTEALNLLLNSLPAFKPGEELINTIDALGRITAVDVHAPHSLPEFSRSTMDGYAVKARDTFGITESLPAYLTFVGEVHMGTIPIFSLNTGQAAMIHTGGMLPVGADSVVMLEHTQKVSTVESPSKKMEEVEISRAVAKGENVLQIGEDVEEGQLILAKGIKLRPVEIGGCMALGLTKLRVAIKPNIAIISTGNEIIPPDKKTNISQVRDINSYSLAGLVTEAGGEPILYGIVPDKIEMLKTKAAKALRECDMVVITAGSSASSRDITAEVIGMLGKPGVLVHGINVRPGKPTVLSICDKKAVIGLPGNPVSALIIARLFIVPVIEKLLGLKKLHPRLSVMGKLIVNIPSQAGREDWIAVKLIPKPEGWLANPVFGKSNLIFSLATADGIVRIPPDATGLGAGEMVEIFLI